MAVTQVPVGLLSRRIAVGQAVSEPVLDRLGHGIGVRGHRQPVGLIAQHVLGLSLGPTGCLPHDPLTTAVVADGDLRDPALPCLVPPEAAVTSGSPGHAAPVSSDATYSDSAATGTKRLRPAFTVRSR